MLVWLVQKIVYFLKWITLQDYKEEKARGTRRAIELAQSSSDPSERARQAGL